MSGAPTGRPEAGIAEVFAEQLQCLRPELGGRQRAEHLPQLLDDRLVLPVVLVVGGELPLAEPPVGQQHLVDRNPARLCLGLQVGVDPAVTLELPEYLGVLLQAFRAVVDAQHQVATLPGGQSDSDNRVSLGGFAVGRRITSWT